MTHIGTFATQIAIYGIFLGTVAFAACDSRPQTPTPLGPSQATLPPGSPPTPGSPGTNPGSTTHRSVYADAHYRCELRCCPRARADPHVHGGHRLRRWGTACCHPQRWDVPDGSDLHSGLEAFLGNWLPAVLRLRRHRHRAVLAGEQQRRGAWRAHRGAIVFRHLAGNHWLRRRQTGYVVDGGIRHGQRLVLRDSVVLSISLPQFRQLRFDRHATDAHAEVLTVERNPPVIDMGPSLAPACCPDRQPSVFIEV